jgi:hypothetical protein
MGQGLAGSEREREAALDPDVQFVSLDVLRVDPEPALHRPAAHHHLLGRRRLHELVRLGRVDPSEEAALPARSDGHIAVDQEGEAAEHRLLLDALLSGDEVSDPRCELLVVGHGLDATRCLTRLEERRDPCY